MNLDELPGGEWVTQGLADLHQGHNDTVGALLVSMAASRLRGLGLDVPYTTAIEAELKLYRLLQSQCDDPYTCYNGLVARLVSFCNALEHHRWRRTAHIHPA